LRACLEDIKDCRQVFIQQRLFIKYAPHAMILTYIGVPLEDYDNIYGLWESSRESHFNKTFPNMIDQLDIHDKLGKYV